MNADPDTLPEFGNPPIAEVAVSIQFDAIEELNAAVLGLLWGEYSKNYPHAEQHPPLPRVVETFEDQVRSQVKVEKKFPTPRLWFITEGKTKLIQVQPDRFIVNWRGLDSEEKYPRYSTLREELLREFVIFQQFVRNQCERELTPNQAELTYVNHIPQPVGTTTAEDLANLLRVADWQEICSDAEDFRLRVSYLMNEFESPIGRVHLDITTANRVADGAPLIVLQLVGRGSPKRPDIEGALEFLDIAHYWLVTKFAEITTSEMHAEWERTQ